MLRAFAAPLCLVITSQYVPAKYDWLPVLSGRLATSCGPHDCPRRVCVHVEVESVAPACLSAWQAVPQLAGVLSEHTRMFISGFVDVPSQSSVTLSVVVAPSTNLKYMHGFCTAVAVRTVSKTVLTPTVSCRTLCEVSAAISGHCFALSAAVV